MHVFPWQWRLTDLSHVENNGLNVMSTFSCCGGSSMGYKLAGYNVIANVEIDPVMNRIYNKNLHPKHSYNMDIRDFVATENDNIPPELFSLDILDGSPPCSTFSMNGIRQKAWNEERQFHEGQKKQRLDDLFFHYLDLVQKLKPKVAIAENVKGLALGNAKGYVRQIIHRFQQIGYDVQMFLLNASSMGVPQTRERIFFIARRRDLYLPKLVLNFNEPPIPFRQVRSERGTRQAAIGSQEWQAVQARRPGDRAVIDVKRRIFNKNSRWAAHFVYDDEVCPTITAGDKNYRMYDGMMLTDHDNLSVSTFPQDYDFMGQRPEYAVGMCVPPVMTAQIARQVYYQWLK